MLHCTMARLDDEYQDFWEVIVYMIAYWIVQRCVSKQPILPTVVDCMRSLILMVLPRCVVVVELLTKALL